MGLYDVVKKALTTSGSAVRQPGSDQKQQNGHDNLPYEAVFSDTPVEAELARLWARCKPASDISVKIRLHDASNFCDALMESMSAWKPSESRPDEVRQKQAWFTSLTGSKTVAGIDAGHPPEVTHFLTQIIQDAALHATVAGDEDGVSLCMLEAQPSDLLLSTAVGALVTMMRCWYNRAAMRRCAGLSILSASLQRCAACLAPGVNGDVPGPRSPPAKLLELIINILSAYVTTEAKQHDVQAFVKSGAGGDAAGGAGERSAAGSGGAGGPPCLGAIGAAARFATAVEAQPPVAVSCAKAIRSLQGVRESWSESSSVWHSFMNQAMQLAEVLASRSRTVADSLFSSGVVPPICAVLTACSIAAPAAAPAPGDTPAPDATAVLPPQLPHVLRALRALRYLAAASDGRRTAASDLLRHGAFQALCRLLVQAAAIADTDEGSVPEHAGSDEAMAKAAAVDAGCISDAQVRVFRSVMAKMPPTLLQRGPSLHALASEIAMWLVVHHLGDRSADVLTPLCSAVLDCFAGDAKAMRLEQPAALLDDHMAMAAALVQGSADLQRVAFAFFSVLLDAAPACPSYLHTLHLGPVLLGPCFFQHSMAEQRSGAPRSLFGSMTFLARDGGEESGGDSALLLGSDDDGPAVPVFKNIPEERSFESAEPAQSPTAEASADSVGGRRRSDAAAAAVFAQPLEQHTGFEPVKRGTGDAAGLPGDVRPLRAQKVPSRSQLSESLSHMQSDGNKLSHSLPSSPGGVGSAASGSAAPATTPASARSFPTLPIAPPASLPSSLPIAIHPTSAPPRSPGLASTTARSTPFGDPDAIPPVTPPPAGPVAINTVQPSQALGTLSPDPSSFLDVTMPTGVSMPHSVGHGAALSPSGITGGSYCDVEAYLSHPTPSRAAGGHFPSTGHSNSFSSTPSNSRPLGGPRGGNGASGRSGAATGGSTGATSQSVVFAGDSFGEAPGAAAARLAIRSLDGALPDALDGTDAVPLVLIPAPPPGVRLPLPVLTELRQTALQLYELWVIQCISAEVPGAADLLMQSLHERVRRAMPFARPLASLVLDLLHRLFTHQVSEPCAASLVRCRALQTSVNLIAWLQAESSRDGDAAAAAPPASAALTVAAGIADVPAADAVAMQLRQVLCCALAATPSAAAALLSSERSVGRLFQLAKAGWHEVAVPVLSALLFSAGNHPALAEFAARYLDLLRVSLSLPAGFDLTKELLYGLQQQRRGRAAEAQHVLAALRKLRALDTILTVGRLLPAEERGASAGGEAVLVECLQCILALVRGNGTMRAHFRRDIQLASVLELVHDCMGAAKVQRNVLAVVLGIALEAKYDSAKPPPQIVNPDAAPLFFKMLQQASLRDTLWGLAVWLRLVTVDATNAQACSRSTIFPMLLAWFRGDVAATGPHDDAPGAPHPAVQARLALLLRALAPHACSAADLRELFQLLQPVRVEGAGALLPCRWPQWKALLVREQPAGAGAVLPRTAVIVQKILHRMAQEDTPSVFFHVTQNLQEFSGNSGGYMCNPAPPVALPSFTFSAWVRLNRTVALLNGLEEAPSSQDRSCQCLLAMLSDDPSLQRQRAAAEPAGIAVLVRDGHVVVASVAAGSHVISLGGSPKLQPCKWTHVAVTFEGLTFGTAGNVGVTTSQVSVFVDGQRVEVGEVRVPRVDKVRFAGVCTSAELPNGGSGLMRLPPIRGQLATVHFFDAPLPIVKIRLLHSLGFNYLGTFSAKEAAIAQLGAEAHALLGGRGGLNTSLAAAFAPSATEGPALVDYSKSENPTDAQRPILADVMPGTTVCRVIRPRDLLHALGGVASLLPLLLLLTVPPAAEGSPAAEPPLSAADEALLMESSELHRGDTADRQGPSSPRASTAVLQSPHRDEKAMLQELCKVLAGRGPSFGVAPGFSLLEILEMVQRALECSSNRDAMVRDGATLVAAFGALLRMVALEHLDSRCTRALFGLATAAANAGAHDLSAAIWRHVLADLRLWHAAKAEEELRALRQLLNAACAPVAAAPGIVSPAHAATSPAAILDGLRTLLCPDAFSTNALGAAPVSVPLMRADSAGPAQPAHLAIALLGTLALTPAVGMRSGGFLRLTGVDYCAVVAAVADCEDDGLLAVLLQEVHKTTCTSPERAEQLRALAAPHGGALPFLPLLTRPDVTLRCAALALIVPLAPAAPSVAEQTAMWRKVSNSLVSCWRLHDGDTRDTLLGLLSAGPACAVSEPMGLRCKELIAPTLRLIAACRDTEHRTAALEGFRKLVEVSVDSKKAMLSVPGWYLPVLEVLPKAGGGYSSSTSTPSSATPPTGRSAATAGGHVLPQADPLARTLLSSLLVHSVLHCEQGANDVNAVTAGLRRKHAEGELAGDSALAWLLSEIAQELVNCDPAAWSRAMRDGGAVVPHKPAGAADDRADEDWLMVLPEHRAANIVAAAAVMHEFLAGVLFLPGLLVSVEEVRPNVDALLWAHKHWMTAEPTAMGQSTPGERRECLHSAVWTTFHVLPPKEVAAAATPASSGSGEDDPAGPLVLPPLPAEVWSLLLPPLWKFVMLVAAVTGGARPGEGGGGSGPVGGGGAPGTQTPPRPPESPGGNGGGGVSMADMPPGEWKVGGGTGAAMPFQRDAKEMEGEMISAGRGSLPLRICMFALLRALEQPLPAAQKVFKDGGAAVVALVNRLGPLYFNHVHLFILLLHQAKRARLEADKETAAVTDASATVRRSATMRRDGGKDLSYVVDSFIVQFQATVAYSLRDSMRVASMLRQPKDVGTILPNIMPMRAQAAAAVELLWRVDSLERRKATDKSADAAAIAAIAQPAGGASEVTARAEALLAAAAAADATRRAERGAATAATDAAAMRRLRDLLRGLTAERQAWAPVDVEGGRGGDEERHEKLANIEDALRRRVHLKRNRDHRPYDDEDKPSSSVRRTEDDALKELQKLGSQARHTVLQEEADDEVPEEDAEEGAAADGADGGDAAVDAKGEPRVELELAAPSDTQPAVAGGAHGGAARVLIDGCVLVTPRGEIDGRVVVGGATLAFYAAAGSRIWSWSLEDVAEVHHARFLLQQRALHLYFLPLSGHPPALIAAPTPADRDVLCGAVFAGVPNATFFDRRRTVAAAASAAKRWASGDMSNFDYLMLLNTLAGRSYCDLAQYPVFPWVVQDWYSECLDLADPASFRDLSKPIGALNEDRLERFHERYNSLLQDESVAPFFYGTHYSSAGIVLWYLLRMEPFTALARSLQGGRFDHADRLFTSLPRAWTQVLKNSSDVKEMVPEFYYNAAFLCNAEGLDLGRTHSGTAVDDVELPRWAAGSPDEFIRIHREALESDYVSAHLHEWIDLIFGCKQRGPAAVDAANVFHALTYEGSVCVADLPDAGMQRAVLDQIREFGQTPAQLFRRKHPRRTPPPPAAAPLLHAPDVLQRCQGSAPPATASAAAVVALELVETAKGARLVHVNADQQVFAHKWHHTSNVMPYSFAAQLPSDVVVEPAVAGRLIGGPGVPRGPGAYAAIPRTPYIITAGHWDCSLRVFDFETGALRQSGTAHRAPVTCLSIATMEGRAGTQYVLIAGAEDALLSVWPVRGPSKGRAPPPLMGGPCRYLYGHDAPVTAVSASGVLRTAASAAANGAVLLHHVPSGRLLRVLARLPQPATLLATSDLVPAVVAYSAGLRQLRVWHVQGQEMAAAEVAEAASALAVSPCGRLLVVAGARVDGGGGAALAGPMRRASAPLLLWLHSLRRVMRYKMQMLPDEGDVTAALVSPEGCIALGTSHGAVVLLSPDIRRTITPAPNLAVCPVNEHDGT